MDLIFVVLVLSGVARAKDLFLIILCVTNGNPINDQKQFF